MRQLSWNILIQGFVFFLLSTGLINNAFAQDRGYYPPASSSVQVDTSVLQQMEAARYGAAAQMQFHDAQRVYNSRTPVPVEKARQLPVIPPPSFRETTSYESVKNSQKTYTPTLTAPAGKQVDTFIAPSPAPLPQGQGNRVRQLTPPREVIEWNDQAPNNSIAHIPEPNPLPEWRHDIPEAPVTEAVAFPVKVRERTDSLNPALTKLIPAGKSLEPVDQVHVETIPVPARRPEIKKRYYGDENTKEVLISDVSSEASASIIRQDLPEIAGMEIPVPKRRPQIQNASLSFVNESRKDMNMPAIPSRSVETENLENKAVYQTDQLGKTLTKPDRNAVVEQVNARLPEQDKKKTLKMAAAVAPDMKSAPEKKQKKVQERTVVSSVQKETGHTPRAPADDDDHEDKFISMPFATGKTELDIRLQKTLNENVLLTLKNNPAWRVQIQAFASEDREEQASARRLSLSRALSVRDYLMGNGIDSKRIDVRALGSQTNRMPEDRVDLVFFSPENG